MWIFKYPTSNTLKEPEFQRSGAVVSQHQPHLEVLQFIWAFRQSLHTFLHRLQQGHEFPFSLNIPVDFNCRVIGSDILSSERFVLTHQHWSQPSEVLPKKQPFKPGLSSVVSGWRPAQVHGYDTLSFTCSCRGSLPTPKGRETGSAWQNKTHWKFMYFVLPVRPWPCW